MLTHRQFLSLFSSFFYLLPHRREEKKDKKERKDDEVRERGRERAPGDESSGDTGLIA